MASEKETITISRSVLTYFQWLIIKSPIVFPHLILSAKIQEIHGQKARSGLSDLANNLPFYQENKKRILPQNLA